MSSVRHPVLPLLASPGEDDLVLADAVVGQVEGIGQSHPKVVGRQHRVVAHLAQPVAAVAADIGIRPHEHAEVAGEGAHLADAGRPRVGLLEREARAGRRRGRPTRCGGPRPARPATSSGSGVGQERRQALADADRSGAGASPAVRRREGLVQVEVHDVEAGLAGPEATEDRVQVGAVHVGDGPRALHRRNDLVDLVLEDAEGRAGW